MHPIMDAEIWPDGGADLGTFAILIAILVGGIVLMGLATWYSARRPRR